MDWKWLLQEAWALLRAHWPGWVGSLALLGLGAWWGKRRASKQWSSKRFLDRINFSLNSIQDGKLVLRTLIEEDCRTVFLNDVAATRVMEAAEETTAENAILPLPPEDRWYFLNSVLNELSERFAVGFLKRDMGLSVDSGIYLICLTYESSGELRTRKVRAMVIQKKTLLTLPDAPPELERPHHITRFQTLKQLAASYRQDPSNFLEIEICI